jgi:hypothetical protein
MYQIVPVKPAIDRTIEQLGSKPKFWFTDDHGRRMLFKEPKTGEDWAEKVACELCGVLGLPHVHYELAEEIETGKPGVVCETCAPHPVNLVLGNELLLAADPSYPQERPRYGISEHTVEAVWRLLAVLNSPPDPWIANLPDGVRTAEDIIVGYVMLDAWIANPDRHHENWGALFDNTKPEGSRLLLAPSFDHGASLARGIKDTDRDERLNTKDVNRRIPAFAKRARSAFFREPINAKPLSTLEAWRAFAQCAQGAATAWVDQLRTIKSSDVEYILNKVPPHRMSRVCRDFTLQLLCENQRRILDGDAE